MFREADETGRHLHASFKQKQVSAMQQISQNSRLDESALHNKINNCDVFSAPMPAAVPLKYDTVYDPSHPDADWAGMVSLKNQHKKHTQGHASQRLGITQCEHGIVAKEERQEWGHRRQQEGANKNASQLVLAGVGSNEAERFKTEYRRLAEHEGTTRDQLTLDKRLKSVKRIPDPAQARSLRDRVEQGGSGYITGDNTPMSQYPGQSPARGMLESPRMDSTASGYAPASTQSRVAPASLYGKKSFIADIASSISAKVSAPPTVSTNSDVAFSHNRTLVTDNYRPFPGEHPHRVSPVLLVTCSLTLFSTFSVGYTGHRKG
jgi:hypothetical protein